MEINFQKNFAIFLIVIMAGTLSLPFNYARGIEYYQRDWEQTTKADFYTGLFDKTNVIAEWGLPVDNAGVVLDKQISGCIGDLIIDGTTEEYSGVLMNGPKPYCTVQVINGGRLRLVDGWNDYPVGHYEGKTLKISAYSIYVDATSYIDGDGKGYGSYANGYGPGPGLSAPEDGGGDFGASCPWPATFLQGAGGGGGGHGGTGGGGGGCIGGEGGYVCGSAGGENMTRGGSGGDGGLKGGCGGWPAVGDGGYGGGAIFLDAVNIDIRGIVTMQGNNGESHGCAGGGGAGAGGMIVMKARTINVAGSLNVNGGNGGSGGLGASSGGGGGGGRIKIFYEVGLGTINYSMTGGSGSSSGGSGDFYTKQIIYIPTDLLDMPECVDGDLIIDGLVDTDPVEVSGEKFYCAVEITRGGILTVPKEQTLKIHAHSIYVDEDSFVNVDGKGYNGFTYVIPPALDIPADGLGAANDGGIADSGEWPMPAHEAGGGGGGASYVGQGGNGADGSYAAVGGSGGVVAYGDNTEFSLEMGSGGGGGGCTVSFTDENGGNGGGAIFFEAPNISIFGNITAKGDSGENGGYDGGFRDKASGGGGGGSGGTIIIKGGYPDLSGATLDVSGGQGGNGGSGGGVFGGDGGGASGGRIKIFYEGVLREIGTTYIASGGDGGSGAHMGESGANGNIIRDYIFGYIPEIPAHDSYFPSGTFASDVYEIPDYDAMASFDEIQWSTSVEAGVTSIIMEVRASDTAFSKSADLPAWQSIGSVSPVSAGLPLGKYIQFRASLSTSDEEKTPTLHDVYIIYTPDYPEPTGDFNVFGWAWSDNIGWISFNYENCYPAGPSGCPPVIMAGYGVDIDAATGNFSGYAWSENFGWISFEPGDVAGCPDPDIVHGCLSWLDVLTGEVSGWAKVLVTDSWIRLSDRSNGFANDDVYISKATKEFHNFAWSDDYGWISFNCEEGGLGGANICATSDYKVYTTLPFVTDVFNLSNSLDSPCAQSRIPTLSWETDAAPFDYELEIDGNTGTIQESGTIASTNGSWSPACQKCCDIAPYNDITFPNKTYNWRIRAKTAVTPWSDWKNSSFTTLANCYPNPNFTIDPEDPIIGDEIQLCSAAIAPPICAGMSEPSICYNPAGNPVGCNAVADFLWDIPEIPANGSYLDGGPTSENPKIQFDLMSDTYIILEITDTGIVSGSGDCSDNRAGCCAIRKDVSPGFPLPEWEEISPSS